MAESSFRIQCSRCAEAFELKREDCAGSFKCFMSYAVERGWSFIKARPKIWGAKSFGIQQGKWKQFCPEHKPEGWGS